MSWLHTFIELFIPADLVEIDGTLDGTMPNPLTASISGTRIVVNQINGTLDGTLPHPIIADFSGALSIGGYSRDYQAGIYTGIAAPSCARTAPGFAQTLAGTLTAFGANTLRRTDRGLLIEPSRTNLVVHSQTFGSWIATNGTEADNAYTAPDGTVTMDSFADNSTTGQHTISISAALTNGLQYAWSVYVDPAEAPRAQMDWSNVGFSTLLNANFNLSSKVPTATSGISTVTEQSMEKMANGQFRLSITGTPNASITSSVILARITSDSAGRLQSYSGAGTKIGVWQGQAEAGPYPTSPIVTTTTSATRDGDVVTTAFPALTNGAVAIVAKAPPYNGTHVLWQWDDGTENNRIRIYRDSSGHMRAVVTTVSVEVCNLDLGYVSPYATLKVFFAWANNDFAGSLNGNTILSDSSGTPPSAVTTIRVGSDTAGNQWESWIQSEQIYYDRIANPFAMDLVRYPALYSPRPQIFLDTDIDSDIDDVCDILTLLALENQGECDIIGICVSSANSAAAGCMYAILNYYGRTAIPLGQNPNAVGFASSQYDSEVVTAYGVNGKRTASDFPSGLSIYRQAIAAAQDGSVTIFTTGGLSTLADFLNSQADGISSLTGQQMAAQKVQIICPVAGIWPGPNAAAVSDMNASRGFADASIFQQCPVPLVICGVEIATNANIATGGNGTMTNLASNNPARFAWVSYWNAQAINPITATRTAWSQVGFLAFIRGMQDYMYFAGEHGRPYCAGNGLTTFFLSPDLNGAYLRLMPTVVSDDVVNELNELIGTGGTAPASFTLAPSASGVTGVVHIDATGAGTSWTGANPFSIVSGPGSNLTNYQFNSATSASFDFTVTATSGVPVVILDSTSGTTQSFGTTPVSTNTVRNIEERFNIVQTARGQRSVN